MVCISANAHTATGCALLFGLVWAIDSPSGWCGRDAIAAQLLAAAGTPSDEVVLRLISSLFIALGALTFAALQFLVAPYGRYSSDPAAAAYGFKMDSRVAWVLQECPCVFWVWRSVGEAGGWAALAAPNRALLGLFLLHYVNRTFVFPFRMRSGKPTPVGVCALAFLFCSLNGYLQCRALCAPQFQLHGGPGGPDGGGSSSSDGAEHMRTPHFVAGVALFLGGLAVNWHSDHILMGLRQPGETGYKIPRGGAFELVSGANFFGEIVEWTGFAVAAWSLPALAFAVFTFCNIGPRAAQHHKWYQRKFGEAYPKHRCAVIPFLW